MGVDSESANWRLYGGGGILAGALIWLVGVVVGIAGALPLGVWISVVGVLVIGIALFLVAFGETGSNGAVGASLLGKGALVAFGLGWVLFGLIALLAAIGVAAPIVLVGIAAVLVVVAGALSVYAIYERGIARGLARWVLALPVAWGLLWVIHGLDWVSFLPLAALAGVLAALYAITGLLYLLNRRDV